MPSVLLNAAVVLDYGLALPPVPAASFGVVAWLSGDTAGTIDVSGGQARGSRLLSAKDCLRRHVLED